MGLFDLDAEFNFDPDKFADELITEAGSLTDEEKAILRSAAIKTAPKFKDRVALRSTAQRKLDEARSALDRSKQIYDANAQWAEEHKSELEEFVRTRGSHPQARVQTPSGESLSLSEVKQLLDSSIGNIKKEFAQQLSQQDELYMALLRDSQELSADYSKTFPGEALPFKDLEDFAISRKLTLRNAYPLFITPKLEAKRSEDIKRQLDEAFERGKSEGLSSREEVSAAEYGGDSTPSFKDHLMGRQTQKVKDSTGKELEGEDAFVNTWNKTRGFTVKEH